MKPIYYKTSAHMFKVYSENHCICVLINQGIEIFHAEAPITVGAIPSTEEEFLSSYYQTLSNIINFKSINIMKSKYLFMLMREQEIQTSNFVPTKKEIQTNSKKFITDLLDAGEVDKFELLSQSKRMLEAFEVINTEIMKVIPQENFEAFGLKGTFRSGGDTVNYAEDEIYSTIKKDLDARAELLKLAQKQPVIDMYGNLLPKVSITPRKSSLTISF